MLPDTLIYDTASLDETGAFTPDGNPVSVDCHIEGESVIVTDRGGKEVVSTIQVFVDVYNLTVNGHVYTIPSRFDPYENLEALAVDKVSDENGPYYEMIML